MKILILECDENLRQLYSTVFENLGSNIAVTEAENAEEAIKFCTCDSYDVILSCYELKPTCSSDEFLAFYQQQDLNIPLVLITSVSMEEIGMNGIEDSENIFHFLMPVELDDIVDKVGSLVYNRKFSETTIDSNFVKVKSAYFIPYGRTLTDIFLRLSSSKLIKILSAGSLYSIDDIEKYLVRGVRHFYVGRSEFDRYDAKEGDCAFLERVITPSETSEFDQWSKGHKALKFLIEEFGISQNTINVASEVTSATIHKILENKEQASYFDIKNKKGKDFIFDHSYVVSIIGCGILKHLKTASKHELENLCYMSLFHDISHNRDQLARINGISDKKFQELDFKGKKEYLDSVNLSVKLIQDSNYFSQMVKDTSAEYYALLMSQSNSGRAMVKELSLLSRVFIVAHDFVTLLYNSDFEPQESKNLIKELLSKYHKGEYLKVVHALTSCHQDYSDNIL